MSALYGPHDCARYECDESLSGCRYAGQDIACYGVNVKPLTLSAWAGHTLYQALTELGAESLEASKLADRATR